MDQPVKDPFLDMLREMLKPYSGSYPTGYDLLMKLGRVLASTDNLRLTRVELSAAEREVLKRAGVLERVEEIREQITELDSAVDGAVPNILRRAFRGAFRGLYEGLAETDNLLEGTIKRHETYLESVQSTEPSHTQTQAQSPLEKTAQGTDAGQPNKPRVVNLAEDVSRYVLDHPEQSEFRPKELAAYFSFKGSTGRKIAGAQYYAALRGIPNLKENEDETGTVFVRRKRQKSDAEKAPSLVF